MGSRSPGPPGPQVRNDPQYVDAYSRPTYGEGRPRESDAALEDGVLRSMGRTGVCWDDAPTETLWSTLATEFCNRHHWATKAEAMQGVGAWIEDRYNRRRRRSAIGMISLVRFRAAQPQTASAY